MSLILKIIYAPSNASNINVNYRSQIIFKQHQQNQQRVHKQHKEPWSKTTMVSSISSIGSHDISLLTSLPRWQHRST